MSGRDAAFREASHRERTRRRWAAVRAERRAESAGPVETIAAMLLPAVALLPTQPVLGLDWWIPALLLAAFLGVVGVLVRRVAAPIVASAAVAVSGCVAVVGVALQGAAGATGTPLEVLARTVDAIGAGGERVAWAVELPVAIDAEVLALVLAGVAALALLTDALVHVLRLPALAAALAAAPILLPMAFLIEVPPVQALPGVALAAVLLVARALDTRTSRRLPTGHPDRPTHVERGSGADWAQPVALVVLATLAAAVLPGVLPAPRSATFELPQLWQGSAAGTPFLSTRIDLGDELRRPEAQSVAQVATADGSPMLLRLAALSLAGAEGFELAPTSERDAEPLLEGADLGALVGVGVVLRDVRSEELPLPERPTSVADVPSGSWDAANSRMQLADTLMQGLEYSAFGTRSPEIAALSEGSLAASASTGFDRQRALPEGAAAFTELAGSIAPERLSPVERVQRIHAFMTEPGRWTYSEGVDLAGFNGAGGDGWATLERFMDQRSGYCVHYASATAALLRGSGLPSRVVIGFLPGDRQADGTYVVTTNEFHAWAEVWLDDAGWVRVETTPGVGASAPSPTDGATTPAPATPTPTTPETATPTPTATPTSSPTPAASASPSASAAPVASSTDGRAFLAAFWRSLGWVAAAAVLALVVCGGWIARAWARRSRLARGPAGAWRELRATLADLGTRLPASATPGDVSAALAAAAPSAVDAIERIRSAAEQQVFGAVPREQDAATAPALGGSAGADDRGPTSAEAAARRSRTADVTAVRAALLDGVPRWRRPIITLAPASLLRVEA